jgi:YidC/Oxa1 family membrane protein insertase
MEKRALIAVVLSVIIIILWNLYMRRFYEPAQPKQQELTQETTPPTQEAPPPPRQSKSLTPPAAVEHKPPEKATQALSVKEISVETPRYIARFSSLGARLESFKLKHYRASVDPNSPLIEMIEHAAGMPYPLGIRVGANPEENDDDVVYDVRGTDLNLAEDGEASLTFEGTTPGGIHIVKQFHFKGSSYAMNISISAAGPGGSMKPVKLVFDSLDKPKGSKNEVLFEGFLALEGSDLIRKPVTKIETSLSVKSPIMWAGFGYTYFLSALLPANEAATSAEVSKKSWGLAMTIRSEPAKSGTGSVQYTLFIGPKVLRILESYDRSLDKAIYFGYFAFISVPFLHVLNFFHRYTHSYGLDIILLTIAIKLVLWPLTKKSIVSMKRMQKLQPQMQRIKEKYGDDKERLNKEMMDLYKRNHVNPLGGCLPMVLQFPVFIGLYDALRTPIEFRHASFLWIHDLSRPDWESLPVVLFGYHVGIPILVLLMGVSMFVQQWMSPSTGDPNQRRMMMLMPLVFTVMFVSFPSGLTIYWLVNNLLSIGQQYLINRKER